MNKSFWFYDEVYRQNYLFLIGSRDFAIQKAKRNKIIITINNPDAGGTFWKVPNYGYIIWLEKFSLTPDNISYLVHELTHAVVHLFGRYAIKVNEEYDEQMAYYLQYLTRKFLEMVKKSG